VLQILMLSHQTRQLQQPLENVLPPATPQICGFAVTRTAAGVILDRIPTTQGL